MTNNVERYVKHQLLHIFNKCYDKYEKETECPNVWDK